MKMSQYLSSSKIPVSMIWYSLSSLDRFAFSFSRSSYGNFFCGYLYRNFMYECCGTLVSDMMDAWAEPYSLLSQVSMLVCEWRKR